MYVVIILVIAAFALAIYFEGKLEYDEMMDTLKEDPLTKEELADRDWGGLDSEELPTDRG